MSKTKSKILCVLLLVFVLVSSYCYATVEPRTSEPETTSEEKTTAISEGEQTPTTPDQSNWTNGDLFLCQDKVTVSNVVDGNAFVIGKEVTITGEIGGDLFVIADKLNLEGGYVYSSIFACANEIVINGVVYDIYAVCNNFTLENNGFVYRNMNVTASSINLLGKVRRDAFVSTPSIQFAENTDTVIYGNLHYSNSSEISIPEGSVGGEVNFTKTDMKSVKTVGATIASRLFDLVKTLLLTFVATLVLLWLTPKFIERVGNSGVAKSFISLGIGIATPFAFVIASVLLILSTVGISVFVCGLFAFIALAFIGTTMASIFFGKLFTKLLKMKGNVKFILFTLLSTFVIWAISLIPVIGGFVGLMISLFGIGITLVNMVWKKEKVEEVKTDVTE